MGNAGLNASGGQLATAPVFIVGAPRSGTTWLQRMLLSESRVCGGQESHFFYSFGRVLRDFEDQFQQHRQIGLPSYWKRAELVDELQRLWFRTMEPVIRADATVLVEKSPSHALAMPQIAELLPQSRFIHLIRDSRAVVASLLAASREPWGSDWAPSNVKEAALEWGLYVREARNAGRQLGADRYLELHYEDLRADSVAQISSVFSFIGLEVNEEEIRKLVTENEFDRQKQIGGEKITICGEWAVREQASSEPPGFFRKGSVDSWKTDLSLFEKLTVWRYTRRQMWECGYNWAGRVKMADAKMPEVCPSMA
jgi:hypothetical protein